MTINELLRHLTQHIEFGGDGDSQVLVWDTETSTMEPLTTIVSTPGAIELTAEGE